MQENADQNNSEYGHFLRSLGLLGTADNQSKVFRSIKKKMWGYALKINIWDVMNINAR